MTEKLECMDCGTTEDVENRQAPSGSYLPRCPTCIDERWKKNAETEKRLGVVCWSDCDEPSQEDMWGE